MRLNGTDDIDITCYWHQEENELPQTFYL